MKFKIGDKVIWNEKGNETPYGLREGFTGTVVVLEPTKIGVAFDQFIEGHNLRGHLANDSGLWFYHDGKIVGDRGFISLLERKPRVANNGFAKFQRALRNNELTPS